METYYREIVRVLTAIRETQGEAMERAAAHVARTLAQDGLVYLFGCGHSHMLAEEGFYRAGGLGAVSAVLPAELMLHEGAVKSSALERRADLAADIAARYPMGARDTLVVFSTSGINGLPVEMARLGREAGAAVIAASSGAYREDTSRHPQGLRLPDVCDVWIDTCVPHGDAALSIDGLPCRMGPVSTHAGAYILHALLARAAQQRAQAGDPPAASWSGNLPGGRERNEAVIRRYRNRIRAL